MLKKKGVYGEQLDSVRFHLKSKISKVYDNS